MEITNEMKFRIALGDKLVSVCSSYLNISFDDDLNTYVNGKIFEPYDYEFIEIPNVIPYENDCIDGILIFGDGTIEFHLQNSKEAFNWNEFNNEIIIIILKQMIKLNLDKKE